MLTNDEILTSLLEKEKNLSQEVDRLEKAKAELAIIRSTIKIYSPLFEITKEAIYDPSASWKERVWFALKALGKSSVPEVVEFIQKQEPDNNSVKNNVAAILSRLASNNEIKSKQESNGSISKYIYYIE